MKRIHGWDMVGFIVGLIVIALILIFIGVYGPNYRRNYEENVNIDPPKWQCKYVVGNSGSMTQVQYCHDPATGTCWYIAMAGPGAGKLFQTDCIVHPLQELKGETDVKED